MPLHTFLHNFMNVLVQIANKMGLPKRTCYIGGSLILVLAPLAQIVCLFVFREAATHDREGVYFTYADRSGRAV
jgi:hypothetical protein